MKNQILSMALAWAVSAGLIPETTTTTITDFVGIQGYEKQFELAAVIVLGFIFQSVKPLLELIPKFMQRYADRITAEYNLTSSSYPEAETETSLPDQTQLKTKQKTRTKKVTASESE